MGEFAKIFKDSVFNNIHLLKQDIENCSEEVWEKKFGGNYYWDQLLHAIGSAGLFLGILEVRGAPETPKSSSLNLRQDADPSKAHSKDVALAFLEETVTFLSNYFENLDDEVLLNPAEFFGQKTTYGGILSFLAVHLAYHVGACDVILRENGLEGAL
ncbi:MAG: DinB family protein [Deferribacteraceae bacterium]|jgi:uncharacterized damage-inducible protein DinB|nr:DinB family protein [Deferribacteraceae bacterium]